MNKLIRLRHASLFLFLSFSPLFAREGFNTAFKLSLSGSICKNVGFILEEDLRPDSRFGNIEWTLTTTEINYRLTAHLRTGAGYMLMARLHKSDGLRNRYYAYAASTYSFSRFTFSVRERFQSTYRRGASHPQNYLRSMLMISYRIPQIPLSPFVYIEPFNNTGYNGKMHADKIRFSTGCDYKWNSSNALQLYYRYHLFNIADPLNYRHALGMTYSHRF